MPSAVVPRYAPAVFARPIPVVVGLGLLLGSGLLACQRPPPDADVAPTDAPAPAPEDPMEVYEGLEAKIAEGSDTEDDRKDALERVRAIEDDGSPQYAFARAAIVGRVAELRGIKAGKLVTEAEQYAKLSMDRDPQWRDRAAARMLGTLWVMAPGRLLEHGDSETGISMLEELAESAPDVVENQLRLGEAYLFFGDPESAGEPLCRARAGRDALRPDEAALLDKLIAEAEEEGPLPCADANPS